VSFRPHENMLQSGNQPLHILRALADLGETTVRSDIARLPAFDTLDPELIHIGWEIDVAGSATRAQVAEVFDWVEGECELVITPLGGAPVAAAPALAAAAPAAVPDAPDRRGGDRRTGDRGDRRAGDRRKKPAAKDAGSIRVGIDKVDNLMNLVGELVITQAMLSQYGRDAEEGLDLMSMRDTLEQLARNTRELQEAVMQVRMLPVSVTFSRFPRLVHDLGTKLGKKVELELSGEQTELDKTVLEKIGDPLVHLIRNSLDHGIEDEATRLAAGKPAHGTIFVSAAHESGNIVIRVADDGGGLNGERILRKARERGLVAEDEELSQQQIHDLIFMPGFSTADVVSDVSGRGVGMDVVRSNITEIGGRVDVSSTPGEGSVFQITLPLTLAILDGQLVRVGVQTYVIPLLSIIETVQVDPARLNVITGQSTVYRLRGEAIPVVNIHRVLKVSGDAQSGTERERLLVIVESGRSVIGLAVDELLEQHQVVIKSLESNFRQVPGTLGATILGDGTVSLIIDIAGLVRLSGTQDGSGAVAPVAA
jgi:two-component system chemotaxis sensor kinase CheA